MTVRLIVQSYEDISQEGNKKNSMAMTISMAMTMKKIVSLKFEFDF